MTKEQLWQATLGELELSLSKANFTTWFKNTFITDQEDDNVVIGVPNAFTKTWLENKYHPQIVKAIQNSSQNKSITVSYKVISKSNTSKPKKDNAAAGMSSKEAPTEEQIAEKVKNIENISNNVKPQGLNSKYTFENFVVGKKNELAQAACLAVARTPGEVYNPLFIYGGVGLGKTHIMQAVGNKILESHKDKKVLYVTCEQFTNEFIKAVQEGRGGPGQFKQKYRNIDVLLIDDIQFIAGKEATQEEFFHTFNHLHQSNKQVVLTSDRPPKAIPALENRLISRFEWGMIVDVGPPELETRIAILRQKCKEKDYQLSDDVFNYLANNIQNNIRELEGALNKVIAHQQLYNKDIDLEAVKEVISPLTTVPKKGNVTPKKLISIVGDYFDIKISDLIGSCRKKELVTPRQIAMYLMREELNSSYPNIGQELGGRDHTTAMHAVNKISKAIDGDEKLKRDINLIQQKLYT